MYKSQSAIPKVAAIMLSCFGDESADETKQRVFAVVGVIGNESQWEWLAQRWIGRNCGIPFHANECESDKGDYLGRKHEDNLALYKDLINMLADSGLVGFGFAIDLIAQRKIFPNAPDLSYFKGFLEVLDRMNNLAKKHSETVKFTFHTSQNEVNAGLLYGQVIESMPELRERFYPELSFATSGHYRVQVADLMARETMKALDNMIGPIKRPARKSWMALSRTNRFMIDVVSEDWFADLKRKLPEAASRNQMEEWRYREWLKQKNRQDTPTNLFLWMYSKRI